MTTINTGLCIILTIAVCLVCILTGMHDKRIEQLEADLQLLEARHNSMLESYTVLTELYTELAHANLGRKVERAQ